MTVKELSEMLCLEAFNMPDADAAVKSAYCGDMLSRVMCRNLQGNAWITVMSGINTAAVALAANVSCIILAENVKPDADLSQAVKDREINLLLSDKSAFCIASEIGKLL